MSKLDNTLIIYISGDISGDNGASAEGTLLGTSNEVASLQGVEVPVEDQLKYFYDVWGSDLTYPHYAAGDVGIGRAIQLDQADRFTFWRHSPGNGDLLGSTHHRQGRSAITSTMSST